jgi:hypothetical protein
MAWNPNCQPDDRDHHSSFVGFAHVHLPDSETGQPYLGFSDRDFLGTVADGDNLALVTNGPEVFALVRTADCTLPRQDVDDGEFRAWTQLYDDVIGKARDEMASEATAGTCRTEALDRALWQANRELCDRLGFAFYRGLWGEALSLIFRLRRPRSKP